MPPPWSDPGQWPSVSDRVGCGRARAAKWPGGEEGNAWVHHSQDEVGRRTETAWYKDKPRKKPLAEGNKSKHHGHERLADQGVPSRTVWS